MWKLDEMGKPTNEVKDEKRFHLLACFVEGTMIATEHGEVPIEQVKVGDNVLTRQGYHKVTASSKTGENRETMTACFSDGAELTGTPDHPVFVNGKGWVDLTSLRYGDTIESWKEKQLLTGEQGIIGIQNQKEEVTASILSQQRVDSIVSCGRMLMERYLKATISTIKMMTHRIMNCLTLSARKIISIWQTIWLGMNFLLIGTNILREYAPLPLLGLSDGQTHRTGNIVSMLDYGKMVKTILRSVNTVARNTKREIYLNTGSVQTTVSQLTDGHSNLTMRQDTAQYAGKHSPVINTSERKHARQSVVFLRAKPHLPATVYNLSVEDVPEYYANGILVHNCLRYLCTLFNPETLGTGQGYRTTTPTRVSIPRR